MEPVTIRFLIKSLNVDAFRYSAESMPKEIEENMILVGVFLNVSKEFVSDSQNAPEGNLEHSILMKQPIQ